MSDHELMQSIRDTWGAAIDAAVAPTGSGQAGGPIPAALIAALIANESYDNIKSTDDSKARRFEKDTFAALALLVMGKKAVFSPPGARKPIGATDVLTYIDPAARSDTPWVNFSINLKRLAWLATSHGLTQVMGWHWIEFDKNFLTPEWTPQQQLEFTVLLLTWFANHYTLDVTRDFEQLLRCWNTGRPGGETSDPNYVPHGIARLVAYRQLEEQKV